ncbi:hypothetical protein PG994_004321 [Apiospora phragmitis]|uniref:Uncharacterized protein n=1 Tax=Apiospora phragmitis TaxID=2905665 RepID=A0ABR1VQH9_9PEZI
MVPSARTHAGGVWKDALHPWIWEILLCVTSSSLLTSTAIILANVDGHPQEEWSFRITLNSLVNILSTLFRACLAATAAEVISQQKWIWFWSTPAPGRPIRQVQAFEEGSRSSLGALKLLPTVATRRPSIISPITILLASLSIGPFAQQSIRTVYKEVSSGVGTASLPIVNNMNSTGNWFISNGGGDYIFWNLRAAPKSATFNTLSNPSSKDSMISPGGGRRSNSTLWEIYDLPNGMKLIADDGTIYFPVSSGDYTRDIPSDLGWAESLMTSERSALARWALVNTTVFTMTIAKGAHTSNATTIAAACSLYPCVRSYSAKVQDNNLSEVVLDNTPLVPDFEGYSAAHPETMRRDDLITNFGNLSLAALQPFCEVDGKTYPLTNASQYPNAIPIRLLVVDASPNFPTKMTNEGCITRMENLAYGTIGEAYARFLSGHCSWDSSNGAEAVCNKLWLAQFWGAGARLLVLDVFMLVWMIMHSVRHRDTEAVWKSNPLLLLYYKSRFVGPREPDQLFLSADFDPLEASDPDRDEKLLTSAELETVADTVNVQLRKRGTKVKHTGDEGEQTSQDWQQLDEPLERVDEGEVLIPESR